MQQIKIHSHMWQYKDVDVKISVSGISLFFNADLIDLTFECIFSYFQEISRLPVIWILF